MVSAAASQLLQQLKAELEAIPANRYWVACSGGIDSHVLLHAMAALRPQLSATVNAVHVNHGLNPAAGEWAAHVISLCDSLSIPCHLFNVDARPRRGESPEAAARDARYHHFSQLIEEGDVLLTAHHREDQAETLLLQLLRGAGPHGLAAMPLVTPFSAGQLARPLLKTAQALINGYAQERSLHWIEDPSNQERGFERNYLRHDVVPLLKAHWPAFSKTVSRAAAHCAEAAGLLDELAAEDLRRLSGGVGEQLPTAQISLDGLRQLTPERRRNVIRFWIKQCSLPIVSTKIMDQISTSLITARDDAAPLVRWSGGELRRYREHLYAMAPLEPFDSSQQFRWRWQEGALELPAAIGRVVAQAHVATNGDSGGEGLSRTQCEQQPLSVRFRQGGERCRLPGRTQHHQLKGLLQQAGVPPWQRDRIPLIYLGEQLAAVVGYFYCAPFQAKGGEARVTFALH